MVTRATSVMRLQVASRVGIAAKGYLAGEGPSTEQPDVDGRFRIMNQPAAGRIMVFDRISMSAVAMTRSKADGTWRVEGLDMSRKFLVIGFDDRGNHNAAIQDWVSPAPLE